MTGRSIPHPTDRVPERAGNALAGEEIVHSRGKRRGRVNPLVVGSNPTGPIAPDMSFRSPFEDKNQLVANQMFARLAARAGTRLRRLDMESVMVGRIAR